MARDLAHQTPTRRQAESEFPQLRVERFEYVPAALLLRLALRLPGEVSGPARPHLEIERDSLCTSVSPLLSCLARAHSGRQPGQLWRASFAVDLELERESDLRFFLRSSAGALFVLPAPAGIGGLHPVQARTHRNHVAKPWPYVMRRTALMFVVSCQLALAPGLSGAALAAGGEGAETAPEQVEQQPPGEPVAQPPAGETQPPAGETQTPTGAGEETHTEPQQPPSEQGHEPPPHANNPPEAPGAQTPQPPPAAAPGDGAPATSAATTTAPASAPASEVIHIRVPRNAAGKRDGVSGESGEAPGPGEKPNSKGKGKGKRHPKHAAAHPHQSTPEADETAEPTPEVTGSATPSALSEVPQALVEVPSGITAAEIQPPAYLIPIYKEAAHRYKVPWRVLAAINQVESDYGRDLSTSPAGAMGWMQFMPETWQQWAVEADGDAKADPYSPRDAIFTAARYLQASGAEHDLSGAIFAYNHADWYVAEVLFRAHRIDTSALALEKGYAMPLARKYMRELGRTDDGVDIESAPDGAVVYSITPGVVTAVASDPAGFGPNYPVIEATHGSLKGQHIYYGHVAQSLVIPGEHVEAGQPIAIMGHTGDALSLGHGHIEIGFSDALGDPLSHHGASAWTPAGEIMREFLVSLSTVFKVHNG